MKLSSTKPEEKGNCINKSLENCGQDYFIVIITSSYKEVQVLDELIDNNIVVKHHYLHCIWKYISTLEDNTAV